MLFRYFERPNSISIPLTEFTHDFIALVNMVIITFCFPVDSQLASSYAPPKKLLSNASFEYLPACQGLPWQQPWQAAGC